MAEATTTAVGDSFFFAGSGRSDSAPMAHRSEKNAAKNWPWVSSVAPQSSTFCGRAALIAAPEGTGEILSSMIPQSPNREKKLYCGFFFGMRVCVCARALFLD